MNNSTGQFRSYFTWLVAVVTVVLLLPELARAQGRPGGRPGSREPVPNRERLPNQGRLPATPGRGRPGVQINQALITLTLEPAVIYQGDRVTLRWEVNGYFVRPGNLPGLREMLLQRWRVLAYYLFVTQFQVA